VLTAIVQSDVGSLSTLELVGACTLLLFGGHETTASLIDQSLAVLMERPDLSESLRAEPALWPTAVDEFMRTVGPARSMARKVAESHERGGRALAAGDTVFLSIAAANHDDEVFAAPEVLDLARAPNPHLGFGWGAHFCLGSSLARLEARIALATLLERFPRIRLAAPLEPVSGGTMGFSHRPVVVHLR
jgi:cytochrome P450